MSGPGVAWHGLGALERTQMKESAGDIEIEGVERVADRILEAVQDEEKKLRELVGTVKD